MTILDQESFRPVPPCREEDANRLQRSLELHPQLRPPELFRKKAVWFELPPTGRLGRALTTIASVPASFAGKAREPDCVTLTAVSAVVDRIPLGRGIDILSALP